MKHNPQGFGAVGAILLVTVIGVIGFAGWQVVSRQNNEQPATTNASKGQSPALKKPAENHSEKEAAVYLDIKEWGIRVKPTGLAEGATYTSDGPEYQYVTITTPRLIELADTTPGCEVAKDSVTLNRAKVGDANFGSPWTEEELQQIGTKLGEYYYFQSGGQACFGHPEELEKIKVQMDEIYAIRASLGILYKTVTHN